MPATVPVSVEVLPELKILVERVVRPLRVPLARQKRLRTEFLDHLRAIHAEELARDNDPAAALLRTQQRFGNPTDLTAELQASLPVFEPHKFRFENFWAQRPAESNAFYAVRLTSRLTIVLTAWIALMTADHHFFGTERSNLVAITVALAAAVSLSVWLSGFLLFGLWLGSEWERPGKRWVRILLPATGLIAVWPASLMILMVIANGSLADYSIPLVATLCGGVFSVLMGTVVGVLHHRETCYRREWSKLPLDVA